MANDINIDNDVYDSDKPFTSKIAKQIYGKYGKIVLDKLLMQRFRDEIKNK